MSSPDLVIRGLPYESTQQDIENFFGIGPEQVRMSKWRDSGRCRGIAFLSLNADEKEIQRINDMDGQTFVVEDNERQISVTKYEEREPKQRERRPRGRNNQRRNNYRSEKSPVQFEENDESRREIYVSNIPWEAQEEDFREVFGEFGEIEDITIPTIHTTGRPKGFAFVRFASPDARDRCLDRVRDQEMTIKDRQVAVRENKGRSAKASSAPQSRRRPRREGLSEKPENCRTIFVGNLPWSTDENQLAEIFAEYGAVASSRIVTQSWSGKSRGFGYVEFEDGKCVDEAVKDTKVVEGRTLRLDYADQLKEKDENEENDENAV